MGRRVLAFGVLGLALAVVGLSGSSSRAEMHPWSVEELRIAPAEFARHQQALALDGMALEAAEGLYQQYEQDFNDLREGRKLSLDWLYSHFLSNYGTGYEPDDAIGVTVKASEREMIGAWNQQSRALAERYFDDLAVLLSVDRETTEALRRAHRRHRLRDLTAAMGGRIAGVNLDLVQVMDEVHPDWRGNHELRTLMQAYEITLDALLRRADAECVTYSDRIRATWLRARKAADEREREVAIDAYAQVVFERHEPLPLIRGLHVQSIEQFGSRLPAAQAAALRFATDRTLRSYLYDHTDAAHARLRLALARRDLSEQQQQTLKAIGEALAAARAAAGSRLDGLYDRSISAELLRRKKRALAAARWTHQRAPAEMPEEEEFREARERWRQTERGFNRQIAAILGERWPAAEPLDPALIVEPEEPAADDSNDWLHDMLAPAIGRADIEQFASSLPPDQAQVARAIRERHAQLLADYEAEANECRQRMLDGMRSLNAFHHIAADDPEQMERLAVVTQPYQDLQYRWHERRVELDRTMLAELTLSIGASTGPAWNRFVQAQRRKRYLPESDPNSGDSSPPDLVRELQRIDLESDARDRLSAMADIYADEIGMLLVLYEDQRNRAIVGTAALMEEDRQGIEDGPARQALVKSSVAQVELMRQVDVATRRHTEVMAGAMDPDAAAAFREAIQRHRWPAAFAISPAAWAAERLLEIGPLDEAQREAAAQLLAASRAAMASLRQQIITATEQWMRPGEPERRWAEREALLAAGNDPSSAYFGHPAIDMLKRRMRQEEDDRARLRGLLRADQLELCPPGVRLVLETEP